MNQTSFFSFFLFLSFTFSSFGLDPAALKVRITSHALNILRDEALAMFQEQVEGKVFEGFQSNTCGITNVRLTGINVNQAHLSFVENYGFQFMIQNFGFTLNFDATFNLCFFQLRMSPEFILRGVAANMEVGLVRNRNGGLAADMRACQASADQIGFVGTTRFENLEARARRLAASFISTGFCPVFKRIAPFFVNILLNRIPMVAPLPLDLGINFDYTLTRDIQVTATSLDVAFKGQAYREQQPPPVVKKVVEPVFTEDTMMAYIGLSEFFFNSAANCLYEAGSLSKNFDTIDSKVMKFALRVKQFFTQPRNLDEPLKAEVGLTEAPTISITQCDGFVFNMRLRVKVMAPETQTPDVFSVSAVCPVSMMVTIDGNRLTLPSKDINCRIETKNKVRKVLVVFLNNKVNKEATKFLSGWFGEGVEIPFPPEINFIQGNIQYEDGYVVVGGDLRSTPAGRQKVAEMVRGPGR
ncbi:phospholipid transfer protein-like [Poeciliopsis prolifica]|uniref:phospholipid transfer protein-like n=1 Tax=Poeciliopsis prolifica TaxID=188132 RepID=UPI0024138EB1|nr:phospholipid transfer protein-like [Poeciliopsis prolifica]